MALYVVRCARCETSIVRCTRVGDAETRRLTAHLRRCVGGALARIWRPQLGCLLPYTDVQRFGS